MKTPAQLIADALDDAMRSFNGGKGIKQAELSRRSGVPQPTISRTLSGKSIPETTTISRLVDVLGASNIDLAKSIQALIPKQEQQDTVSNEILLSPVFPLRCPECGKVGHKSFIELEMNDRLPCSSCGSVFNINDQYGNRELEMFLKAIGRSGYILRQNRKLD
jgi:transcriptional regulator with XRE-family HTH domain